MADRAGADAYFGKTLRNEHWTAHEVVKREAAIQEAASMLGRLSFSRTPPVESMDGAIYEQAFCLLTSTATDAANAIATGIRSRSIADASESYASAAEREKDPGWINGVYYCPLALSWVAAYIAPRIRTGRMAVRAWT